MMRLLSWLRGPKPYHSAPKGLRDITQSEQDFAKAFIQILNSYSPNFQKVKRWPNRRHPTLLELWSLICPADARQSL